MDVGFIHSRITFKTFVSSMFDVNVYLHLQSQRHHLSAVLHDFGSSTLSRVGATMWGRERKRCGSCVWCLSSFSDLLLLLVKGIHVFIVMGDKEIRCM